MAALILWTLGALIAVATALVVAYTAYEARLARESAAARRAAQGPDPLEDILRVREETRRLLAESRTSLQRARDAVRQGTRG